MTLAARVRLAVPAAVHFFISPPRVEVSLRCESVRAMGPRVVVRGQRRLPVRFSSGAGPMLLRRCMSGLTLSRHVTCLVCVADLRCVFYVRDIYNKSY